MTNGIISVASVPAETYTVKIVFNLVANMQQTEYLESASIGLEFGQYSNL
jgi:hypothetical protein